MARRSAHLALFALALSGAGLGQARAEQIGAPQGPAVNVRLSPDLGDATAAVKSRVEALPNVRIAEPADYILSTKRDYPQTLIAVDADQMDARGGLEYQSPLTTELGNLLLDDYAPKLHDLVARAALANALVARATLRPDALPDMEICVKPPEFAPTCNADLAQDAHAETDAAPAPSFEGSSIELRNDGPGTRYLALFLVDSAFRIHRLTLQGHEHGEPLAAAAAAQTDPISVEDDGFGRSRLVAFWSERPFDPNALAGNSAMAGVSGVVAEHRDEQASVGELGGGDPVMERMAPWIAELYSTIPYTAEEKAADALKPADEQERLRDRSDAELDHRCGGTLIAPEWVLTAAHCVAKGKYAGDGMVRVLKERRIRLGTKFLGDGGTTYAITALAVPAEYSDETKQDDIALLRIKADRDTQPIDVHTLGIGSRALTAGTPLLTYGWGYTAPVPPGQNPLYNLARELQHNPDFLRFGRLSVMDWNACHQKLSIVRSGMVCLVSGQPVNGRKRNVFTCRGDSGGPLVRTVGRKDELVGVTSWSMGCGYQDVPSVFTDVTKYRAWIHAAQTQLTPGAALHLPLPGAAATAVLSR